MPEGFHDPRMLSVCSCNCQAHDEMMVQGGVQEVRWCKGGKVVKMKCYSFTGCVFHGHRTACNIWHVEQYTCTPEY